MNISIFCTLKEIIFLIAGSPSDVIMVSVCQEADVVSFFKEGMESII